MYSKDKGTKRLKRKVNKTRITKDERYLISLSKYASDFFQPKTRPGQPIIGLVFGGKKSETYYARFFRK